jgi:hypothetical protein
MQWADLQTHGDTQHRAFEALCSLLFERWCHRAFPDRVTEVYVTGAGGDGGVESLARLDDGSLIGLQCKWFRDPLQNGQFTQIKSSLNTASRLRAGLIRYVVAVPRNLADGVDKKDSTTERQRWNDFVVQAGTDFPNIALELWDESKIENLLAEVGGKGVEAYWFSRVVVDQVRLIRLFEQAKAGWLANRYSPDLHQAGVIEKEVEVRLNRRALSARWTSWCTTLRRAIHEAQLALAQLAHVQGVSDAPALESAKATIAVLAKYADDLATRLNGPAAPTVRVALCEPQFDIDDLLSLLDGRHDDDRLRHHRRPLERLIEEWHKQSVTPTELDTLLSPVVFIAEAGTGKTHACARLVEGALARQEPALLIRARDFAPGGSTWTAILQRSLEETESSLEELLDTLVSLARFVDVRNAAEGGGQQVSQPCRPLVVIDGLDESIGATEWYTRLAELPATLASRPVTFVVTSRASTMRARRGLRGVSLVSVDGSDPNLDAVFDAYLKASRIDAPPAVRWWLRSPLEVRLFADVYAGTGRDALWTQSFRILDLIRRKLQLVAEALAPTQGVAAEVAAPLVRQKLLDFADSLLRTGGPVSHSDALECLRGSGAYEFPNPGLVLQTLRDRGILLEIPSTTIDPLRDPGPSWDFAFETLHSYVVAYRYAEAPRVESLPYLRQRRQALIFSLVLQENAGKEILMDNDWGAGLYDEDVLALRLTALSLMEFPRAERYRTYVEDSLVASMPSCRAVLSNLVIPGVRVPKYPFGARFVLNKVKDLTVAERDAFWSGPRELDAGSGPWSGSGKVALEGEPLRAADPWDSAPLLLLMSAASVVESHRREVVWSIGKWGAAQPEGLSKLLETLFEGFNDPQVLEDGVAAAWTATCLNPGGDWSHVVGVVRAAKWGRAFPHVPTLRFIRYCELLVSMFEKQRTSLAITAPSTLPIDAAVGGVVHMESGYGPIRGDLTWYVVPQSLRDFDGSLWHGDESASDDWQSDQKFEQVVRAFVEGRIRKGCSAEALDEVRRCIEALEKELAEPYSAEDSTGVGASTTRSIGRGENINESRVVADDGNNDGDLVSDDTKGLAPQGLAANRTERETPWSEQLQELLQQHANQCSLDKLTLLAFAYGYVIARAAEMGWNDAIKDGDIAIQDVYQPATHGSRSEVGSFFEKYLWVALGELRAFLSLRLASADLKGRLAPDRIEDIENPTDLMDRVTVHIPVSRWDALVAPMGLTKRWDRDRASEWVQSAPLVAIGDAAFLNGRDLLTTDATPGALPAESQWIAINGHMHLREANSQAERLVWLSALLIEKEDIAILEDDAQAGFVLSKYKLDDARAGLARDGTYMGPFEALWMTDAEDQTPITHRTLHVSGANVILAEILMRPAIVESTWKGQRERSFFYPVKQLREALAITSYSNGCFLRGDGTIVAVHAELADVEGWNEDGWEPPTGQWLLVRRDLLQKLLEGDVALMVAMKARTDVAGYLKNRRAGWKSIEQLSLLILDGREDREPIEEVQRLKHPTTPAADAMLRIGPR